MELDLSNIAWFAANALNVKGSAEHRLAMATVALEQIWKVSREYLILERDCDANIKFRGIELSFVPAEGWPEPKIEWMYRADGVNG